MTCQTCNGKLGWFSDNPEPFGRVWEDCPDCVDLDQIYTARLESSSGMVRHEPIEDWERLMSINTDGTPVLASFVLHFEDGTTLTVTRDGGPLGDGRLLP